MIKIKRRANEFNLKAPDYKVTEGENKTLLWRIIQTQASGLRFLVPSPMTVTRSRTFWSSLEKKPSTSARTPPSSHVHPALATSKCAFWLGFPALDMSYKWNHTTCDLSWLASFTQLCFTVHPCCSGGQRFIPIYCWKTVHCTDIPYFIYLFINW